MDLNIALVFVALVMVSAIFGSRISSKSGMPVLLVFMVLGMIAGVDGIVGIDFEDYDAANTICSAALIFIMFYGGFGTSWKAARPVAVPSILLASAGVVMTAMLTGLFCRFVLGMQWLDALLLGSVLSSTDAASVFSILRSRRLSLKYGTSSLLEMESGSNDPAAYMLVMIFLEMRSAGSVGFLQSHTTSSARSSTRLSSASPWRWSRGAYSPGSASPRASRRFLSLPSLFSPTLCHPSWAATGIWEPIWSAYCWAT